MKGYVLVVTAGVALSLLAGCATSAPVKKADKPAVTQRDDGVGPVVHQVETVIPGYHGTSLYVTAPRHVLAVYDPAKEKARRDQEIPSALRLSEDEKQELAEEMAEQEAREKQELDKKGHLAVGVSPSAHGKETSAQRLGPMNEPLQVSENAIGSHVEPKSVVKQSETDDQGAWRRYCANGEGLTQDDILLLEKSRFEIPEEFQDNCYPPK